MPIVQAKPGVVGRPATRLGTVRVLPTGVLRLSPDLCTAKTFTIAVDATKKYLIIKPRGSFILWYSNPKAKSGLLNGTTAFELVGVNPVDVAGEYVVRKLKAGGFVVELIA